MDKCITHAFKKFRSLSMGFSASFGDFLISYGLDCQCDPRPDDILPQKGQPARVYQLVEEMLILNAALASGRPVIHTGKVFDDRDWEPRYAVLPKKRVRA